MAKLASVGLVFILLFSAVACGGDDSDDEATIDGAESCEDLADAVIPVMQGVLDAASELTMEDIMSEEPPDILADFETSMEEAATKSEELNCDDEEMGSLLEERVGELTAEGPVGELILEGLQSEGFE